VAVPACNTVEVVESAYQLIVLPVPAVAVKVAVSAPQRDAPKTVVTLAGIAFIVAVAAVRVFEIQPVASTRDNA
jgi:hypothetical protein